MRSFRQLMEYVLAVTERRRLLLPVPFGLARFQATFLQYLPKPPLTPDQEWARLEPTLARVVDKLSGDPLRPRLSVDTYHPEVARRAQDVIDALHRIHIHLLQQGFEVA